MNFRLILLTLFAGASLSHAQTPLPEGVVGEAVTSDAALVTPVSPAPLQVLNPFTKAVGGTGGSGSTTATPSPPLPAEKKSPNNSQSVAKPQKKPTRTKTPGNSSAAPETPSEVIEEAFEGERIGSVNGLLVFRGSNAYLFKPEGKVQVKQTLTPKKLGSESSGSTTQSGATVPSVPPPPMANMGSSQKLPSIVGGPSPSLKPAFSNTWGSTASPQHSTKNQSGSVFNKSSSNTAPPPSAAAPSTQTTNKKSW